MIFFSMALFALVQNRMMNYKVESTANKLLEENRGEMENYLCQID